MTPKKSKKPSAAWKTESRQRITSRSNSAKRIELAYRVLIKPVAEKEQSELPLAGQEMTDEAILALLTDPRPRNSEKVAGYPQLRRLKVPPYRIFYSVNEAERKIVVLMIVGRNDNTYSKPFLKRVMARLSAHQKGKPT